MICPSGLRGRLFAIQSLCNVVLGTTLGPLLVALITDRILGNAARVGVSIAIVAAVMLPVAFILWRVSRREFLKRQASVTPLSGRSSPL
jgi:hypothetical protein